MQNVTAVKRTVVPFVSPVMAVHARLVAWDLSVVKKHAVEQGLYPVSEIDRVEAEYKKWLALAIATDEGIPISMEIDPLWHDHIIFTEDYTRMGLEVAGRYIHHRPAVLDDEKALRRGYAQLTLSLYRENFGEPDPKYWGHVVCKCDGRCGHVSSELTTAFPSPEHIERVST